MVKVLVERKEQALLGSLLGDGGIYYNKTSFRYQESHCIAQRDYLRWKRPLLPFETKYKSYNQYDKRTQKSYSSCKIWSRVHPKLREYHDLKYDKSGKATYPGLQKILNRLKPFGLMVWYLDDGDYIQREGYGKITHKTTQKNYRIIQRWFKKKYGIPTKVRGIRIFFTVEDTKKLMALFQPYVRQVPKNLHYKFGLDKDKKMGALIKKKKYYQRSEIKKRRRKYYQKYYRENKAYRKYKKGWATKNRRYLKIYQVEYYQKHKK